MHEEQTQIFEYMFPTFQISKPIRLIELFAGIGAQAKALENIGADFVRWRAVEIDKYAMKSYNAVHGTAFEPTDITKIHADDLGITETEKYCYIMTYSFPCQDLSLTGHKNGMKAGTRSGLLWEVERLLDECEALPDVLVMENVPNVIGKRNVDDFAKWRSKLESLGYSNYVKCLNAKHYGIPQNRNRCFMVSVLGTWLYAFPDEQPLRKRLADLLETSVDESYYLTEEYVRKMEAWNEKRKRKKFGYRFEPIERTRAICRTITTKWRDHSNALCDPGKGIRRLTEREAWRLMGFADEDFDKARAVCSNGQLLKQAGNSIAVPVLEAIFKQMIPNEERKTA